MKINKFNSEGYHDPTSYDALVNIAKSKNTVKKAAFKPLVYICSAYTVDSRKCCRFAMKQNAIPLAMHLLFEQFIDNNNLTERDMAMHFNYVMLGKCDEFWIFGDTVSKEMARELAIAKKRRQKIRRFNEDLQEVEKDD